MRFEWVGQVTRALAFSFFVVVLGAPATAAPRRSLNPAPNIPTERMGARPIFTRYPNQISEGESRVPLANFQVTSSPSDRAVKPMSPTEPMSVTVVLHRHNEAQMVATLNRIYNPHDSMFHRYLSVEERRAKFSPRVQDFQAVAGYFQSQGLKVIDHQEDRTTLTLAGSVKQIEDALNVRLSEFQEPAENRRWHYVDRAPELPASIAPLILSVHNLNTSPLQRPHHKTSLPNLSAILSSLAATDIFPFYDGIPAGEIRKMYGMGLCLTFSDKTVLGGQGEKLALVEFGGYNADCVAPYISHSKNNNLVVTSLVAVDLHTIPIKNVLVNGFDGSLNDIESEAELDIDMVQAMADRLDQLKVYEAPRADGYDNILGQIRDDNDCRQVSISYGSKEGSGESINYLLLEMAMQGQSVFVSSGDDGAYVPKKQDNGTYTNYDLTVEFPANLPYAVAVGGTQISYNADFLSADYLLWSNETTWSNRTNNASDKGNSAGGGGISKYFAPPQWQYDYLATHSSSFGTDPNGRTDLLHWRMVPDVSLNASPTSGYWTYSANSTHDLSSRMVGGTSAAAPLWAAFNSLVNQARQKNSYNEPIGLTTPALYQIASDPTMYAADFHDINDSSTNGYYKAVIGLDAATGLGSFIGKNLITDLESVGSDFPVTNFTVTPPGGSTGRTATVSAGTTVRIAVTTRTDLTAGAASDSVYADLYQFDKPSDKLVSIGQFFKNKAIIDLAVPAVPQRTVFFYRVDVRSTHAGTSHIYHYPFYIDVTVDPSTIKGITLNPSTIYSGDQGDTTVATLSMSSPAPADLPFSVLISPFSDYSYSRNVTIPQGQQSVQFPITLGSHFPSAYKATVTATYLGSDAKWGQTSADLNIVVPPIVTGFTIAPSSVIGGNSVTGTVRLSDVAISNGVPVSVFYESQDNILQGPTKVTVPVGQSSTTFEIPTAAPASNVTETADAATVYGFNAAVKANVVVKKVPVPLITTSTTFTSAKARAVPGDRVDFTIKVTAQSGTPGGNVNVTTSPGFTFPVALDSTGTGTFSSPDNLSIPAGDFDFVASFPGGDVYAASLAHLHQIFLVPSNVTLSDTPNPSLQTQNVVFTAVITQDKAAIPTGTVRFVDKGATPYASGGTDLGTVTVDATGKAAFVYSGMQPIMDHNIVAVYSGDANYNGGYSLPLNHVVNFTIATLTFTPSVNPSFAGQPVVFTATVAVPDGCVAPTGTVYIQDSEMILTSTNMTAASNGKVKFSIANLSVGTHSIGGFFSGNAGLFAGATPFNQVVNVATAGQTVLNYGATIAKTAGGYSVTLTASNVGLATAAGAKLTLAKLGSASLGGMPISLGDIAPGTSVTKTLVFPLSAGASGLVTSLTLSGSYANGTISFAKRITLP